MAALRTLPARFTAAYEAALVLNMRQVADEIIRDAQAQLVPGHGYVTGKLRESLVANLVDWASGVSYEILSEEAEYWLWVELGHMLRNGAWWEGYHYIENALNANRGKIFDAARDSFHMAAVVTRGNLSAVGMADMLVD